MGDSVYLDDYDPAFLGRFEALYLSGFNWRSNSDAEDLVPAFLEGGGRLVVDLTGVAENVMSRRPLIIAKRYDAEVGRAVAVYADGGFVGKWRLDPREFVFGEDTFRVDREFITGITTRLRFQHLPGSGGGLNSFYYWVYTTE